MFSLSSVREVSRSQIGLSPNAPVLLYVGMARQSLWLRSSRSALVSV